MGGSRKIWVVVKSEGGNSYSHASAARAGEGTDEWSSTGCVGPREDFDKEFEILAIGADGRAQAVLQDKGQSMCEDSFSVLPSGAQILSAVKVTRNRRWQNESR